MLVALLTLPGALSARNLLQADTPCGAEQQFCCSAADGSFSCNNSTLACDVGREFNLPAPRCALCGALEQIPCGARAPFYSMHAAASCIAQKHARRCIMQLV